MTSSKDALPGITILMLDMALSWLDRAAETNCVDEARAAILEAKKGIKPVFELARKAAAAESE